MKYHVLEFKASKSNIYKSNGQYYLRVILTQGEFENSYQVYSSISNTGSRFVGRVWRFSDTIKELYESIKQYKDDYTSPPIKVEVVEAVYCGRQGAFGYETGEKYRIAINTLKNGSIKVTRKAHGGMVIYPNRLMFNEVWKV